MMSALVGLIVGIVAIAFGIGILVSVFLGGSE